MAKIIRSAKSGDKWSTSDLLAYNITIQTKKVTEFFGHELCSNDLIDPSLLSSPTPIPAGIPDEARRFLKYLGFISYPNPADSFLSDFAKGLLAAIHFDRQGNATIVPRHSFPLTICGYTNRKVNPDICIITNHLMPMTLLLVQRKKLASGPSVPEPPLIAGAIAAFQSNNESRDKMGLPTLDTMVIPCITVEGTRPLFYKVPVTQHLSNCVATGQFPEEQTVVTRCGPPAPSEAHVGMESLDYRRTALRYYYTFCDSAKDCWAPFITGCKD
jgi:hypothetical protein